MIIDLNTVPEGDGDPLPGLNEEPPADEQEDEIQHLQKDEVHVPVDDEVHWLQEAQSHLLQEDEQVAMHGHPLLDLNVDPYELQQPNEDNFFF